MRLIGAVREVEVMEGEMPATASEAGFSRKITKLYFIKANQTRTRRGKGFSHP